MKGVRSSNRYVPVEFTNLVGANNKTNVKNMRWFKEKKDLTNIIIAYQQLSHARYSTP